MNAASTSIHCKPYAHPISFLRFPRTDADPAALANYVIAILERDQPLEELRESCMEKVEEFLGKGAAHALTVFVCLFVCLFGCW
jgi:hypothetical protein